MRYHFADSGFESTLTPVERRDPTCGTGSIAAASPTTVAAESSRLVVEAIIPMVQAFGGSLVLMDMSLSRGESERGIVRGGEEQSGSGGKTGLINLYLPLPRSLGVSGTALRDNRGEPSTAVLVAHYTGTTARKVPCVLGNNCERFPPQPPPPRPRIGAVASICLGDCNTRPVQTSTDRCNGLAE